MDFIKEFFSTKGFNFKHDLKLKKIVFEKNPALTEKIDENVFFYQCPPQTKTSFYLITSILTETELIEFRKFVWNEDKADLIFTVQKIINSDLFNSDTILNLHYAKISPKTDSSNYKIDTFFGNEKDTAKIDKINKWQFDSGAFWLNYRNFIDKIKKSKSIDKELVYTLEELKKQLLNEIKQDEIVQALIDRTLYIKYLEDNHIINSYFYNHYFQNENLTYKSLLENNEVDKVNSLFRIINEIFNNYLFVTPEIGTEYLSIKVFDLIYHSISGTKSTGQLSLFDFQFNIIPVEFISYIYEIFLKDEQKKNGIFYTPKKLAQLIVDDVIINGKTGKVLDPSCGSGMFLIVAFQKLLENNPLTTNNVAEKIQHRIKLLSENIFGIEKQSIAQRFTIFSLSLQIFRDLNPEEIKDFIAQELKTKGKVELFRDYSFFKNIICYNSLDINEKPFKDIAFDFIVGNPPFFEIKNTDTEFTFLNYYKVKINERDFFAKELVGKHQISQCFFIKIKDWSDINTRFGFVSNNSNFYNDNSKIFQDFFYGAYRIEKIYELSKVKKILFENAQENVNAIIFNNYVSAENTIEYYPVEMGLFSEKPFELLIIQEDKVLYIEQKQLLENKIRLRDFLIGNKFDWKLIKKINSNATLNDYILTTNGKKFIHRGLEIVGHEEIKAEFKISETEWSKLNKKAQVEYFENFKNKYTRPIKSTEFDTPFLKPKNIDNFRIISIESYIGDTSNFHRKRTEDIYIGKKILWNRIGNGIKAVYTESKVYFDFDIYVFKLTDEDLYYLLTSILNSKLIDYYINVYLRKRLDGSYPKIGIEDIKKIPIPEQTNKNLILEISSISNDLTQGKIKYNEVTERKLNELIFELYGLTYLEKQRVHDFFIKRMKASKEELKLYKESLLDTICVFFENPIDINYYHYKEFNLVVFSINFKSDEINPLEDLVSKYMLNEIFEQNPNENFLASQEKIFGKNCIYILRKDDNINWTETVAFEDGQEILNRI